MKMCFYGQLNSTFLNSGNPPTTQANQPITIGNYELLYKTNRNVARGLEILRSPCKQRTNNMSCKKFTRPLRSCACRSRKQRCGELPRRQQTSANVGFLNGSVTQPRCFNCFQGWREWHLTSIFKHSWLADVRNIWMHDW